MDGKISGLQAQQCTDLRRDRLVPAQSLSEHHRFADEHDRRTRSIDGFVEASHAITVAIDRVLDRAASHNGVDDPPRGEDPAKPRIWLAPWFVVGHEPAERPRPRNLQNDFAGDERQQRRGDDRGAAAGSPGDNPSDSRRGERQPDPNGGQRRAGAALGADVPFSRREERRQEMAVEPALVCRDCDGEARNAQRGDRQVERSVASVVSTRR